ncbi:histo-blood group ABO system transferase [Oryctolagus cuniculus]|uniref:histo-blood group ABO system transferase n=1 Tax=Oryctolagus cuniculus TaxID=9986 RepID=UPI003878FB9D
MSRLCGQAQMSLGLRSGFPLPGRGCPPSREETPRTMAQLPRTHLEKSKSHSFRYVICLLLLALVLTSLGCTFLAPRSQNLEDTLARPSLAAKEMNHLEVVNVSRLVYPQPNLLLFSKEDVLVQTPWLAPIVWEETFNIEILNEHFWLQNVTVGLASFAVKKYVVFLKPFLETAEAHFMVGHRVKYYIFTDQPNGVPPIRLGAGRQMAILEVPTPAGRREVSGPRMEILSHFSSLHFFKEVDYLVCAHVDVTFQEHVGVEILSALFGTIHPVFFGHHRDTFAYECWPQSQAHVPLGEGDFYYTEALFGGSVLEVHKLATACHEAMARDKAHHVEAVWHEESYLNKYLLYHKPTKVLSPEYMWDKRLMDLPAIFQNVRFQDKWVLQRITKQPRTRDGSLQGSGEKSRGQGTVTTSKVKGISTLNVTKLSPV